MDTIGCLQELIRRKGITLYYVSKISSIPYSTLKTKIHRGTQLSADEIDRICSALDVPVQEFFPVHKAFLSTSPFRRRSTLLNPKVYVSVLVAHDEDGRMIPQEITWEDGTHYSIDKVTDIRQAAARKAGGQGDRYTVRINGRESYLFFERSANLTGNVIGRWFVERKAC